MSAGNVCDTPDRAAHVAPNGDFTVLVHSWSPTAPVAFTNYAAKTSGQTIFQPDTTYGVTTAKVTFGANASRITWQGFNCIDSTGCFTNATFGANVNLYVLANRINLGQKVDGTPAGALFYTGDGAGLQGLHFNGNEVIGTCCGLTTANSPEGIRIGKPSGGAPNATGVQIDGNTFQYVLRNTAYWPTALLGPAPDSSCLVSSCHADAIHVWGLSDSEINGNKILNSEVQGIFVEDTASSVNSNLTILNNEIAVVGGSAAMNLKGISGNWKIAFNSTANNIIVGYGFPVAAPGTHVTFTGNDSTLLMTNSSGNNAGCDDGSPANVTITYAYNVWRPSVAGGDTVGPCDGTDVAATPAYVDTNLAPATTVDLHLSGAVSSADNFVPATICNALTTTDREGTSRPQNTGFCDAGAYERNASGAVTGASLAACSGTCSDPGYVPDATAVSCPLSGSTTVDAAHHIITFGPINNGSANECRQAGYFVPTNLNPSSSNKPAALLIAGNPNSTSVPPNNTCGPGGDGEIKSTFTEFGANAVAVANRFIVITLAKPCNPTRASWLHPTIDVPACCTISDGPYVSAVVSDIEARFNVDPERIYLAGDSSGGALANGIACEDPYSSLFRGYAPEANLMSIQGSSTTAPTGPVPGTERCGSTNKDFFYINVNGSADTQVSPSGTCLPTHCIDSLTQTGAFWASHLGCATPGATTYNVKRSTSSGTETTIASPGTNSYDDTSSVDGTPYFYVVSAVGAGGQGANSSEVTATSMSAPTGLTATPGNAHVTLSWTSVAGATGYNVKRSTSTGTETTLASPGTNGYDDLTAANGTQYFYIVTATNANGESLPSSEVNATPATPGVLVISQTYGGAGCGTAGCSTYKNDYIELFNRGGSPVSVNGWSVQYAAATGTTSWQVTALPNVSIQPGHYFLVAEGAGANGVNNLPTPDATGTIAMSATAGKVALVSSTTALNGACPSANVVDEIGYGATANCSETSPAPAPSTTTADIRNGGGCVDSGNNSTDFAAAAPTPRNTASPTQSCANNAPTITPPANPIATVTQNAAPFPVNITGSDDGGMYTTQRRTGKWSHGHARNRRRVSERHRWSGDEQRHVHRNACGRLHRHGLLHRIAE